MRFYRNGVLINDHWAPYSMESPLEESETIYLGSNGRSHGFIDLDEVAIFNRALPAPQIEALASGADPLVHQWSKDGEAIEGATSATLSLSNVGAGDAGDYKVLASNLVNSLTSRVASVLVNSPPVIAVAPVGQDVTAGGSVSMSVVASGTGPFSYQWYRDGVGVSEATSAELLLSNVGAADAGVYTVQVSNSVGSCLLYTTPSPRDRG